MRIVKYLITAIGPVVLAWILGFISLPENTHFLDYSHGGTELLNLNEELKKEVKVLVGGDEKEQLSLYSVHFINEGDKHLGATKISFKLEGLKPGSELIASSLQGPENYPKSSITKNKDGITFGLDHVNRAGDQARNYFAASFLFSGDIPENIEPISHDKGVEFRPASENTKDEWLAGVIYIGALLAYIWFFWWINKKSNLKLEEKMEKYHQALSVYLSNSFDISQQETMAAVEKIENIRNQSYRQPGFVKKFLRRMVEEP